LEAVAALELAFAFWATLWVAFVDTFEEAYEVVATFYLVLVVVFCF